MVSHKANQNYSGLQIGLHWSIAALVAFQLVFGGSMTTVRDAAEEGVTASAVDTALSGWHYWVGLAILGLVAARLALRLAVGVPSADPGLPLWMVWAGRLTHWAFYLLLVGMPVLGLLTVYVADEFGDIHKLGKPVFLALIGIHALAALYHHFVRRDATLRRMLPLPGSQR